MKRRSSTANTHGFITAVSAAWADCQYASRRMVEHQMGPRSSHRG